MEEALIAKDLPFELPDVHVDMLWHERDARNPAHKWLREQLITSTDDGIGRVKKTSLIFFGRSFSKTR
jgi:hypothetical protein